MRTQVLLALFSFYKSENEKKKMSYKKGLSHGRCNRMNTHLWYEKSALE